MPRPRKWTNDAERMRAARAAGKVPPRPGQWSRKAYKPVVRSFIAVDGEGLGDYGYHLLAASDGAQIEDRINGLSSIDCLRFLLTLGRRPKPRPLIVGFGIGYDVEHWIRDLSLEQLQSIRETNGCKLTIDGYAYDLHYVPKKWFKLGFVNKQGQQIWIIEVYDLFTFFQSSFLNVVSSDGWNCATSEEWEVLQWGKGARGEFSIDEWDRIVEYNAIECRCLVRAAEKLRAALQEADIHLSSWHGPGAVAGHLLGKHKMKEKIGDLPPEVADAVRRAYFGGRFQVFQLGLHKEVYDYDISSAYPAATILLPATVGRWERVDRYQGASAPWTVYHIEWKVGGLKKLQPLTPFPWRDENGLIHYPPNGRGWYWAWEVDVALNAWGATRIKILDGWRLYPEEVGVFEWMKELAEKRVAAKQAAKNAIGEDKDRLIALQRVYKLALNSIYGKTIQTVGSTRPFLNAVWAGLITSHTRSRLLTEALKDPTSCICFATDGLFSTTPIDVSCGDGLGEWELAGVGEMDIYKSGMYVTRVDGVETVCRVRGIERSAVDWDAVTMEWRRRGPYGQVSLTTRRFVGHKVALARGDRNLHCRWLAVMKREELHPGIGIPPSDWGEVTLWDNTWPGQDYLVTSHPYRKLVPTTDEAEEEAFEECAE